MRRRWALYARLGKLNISSGKCPSPFKRGGKLLCGGQRLAGPGLFFEPTIIECPRQDMTIVDTELFGPVLAVQRFRTEAEVVALANDTKHGLAAGLFTRDGARQLRLAKALKSGMVWGQHLQNDFADR